MGNLLRVRKWQILGGMGMLALAMMAATAIAGASVSNQANAHGDDPNAGTRSLSTVNLTDNVGIGTESPSSKLEVKGAIQTNTGSIKFPDDTVQIAAVDAVTIFRLMGRNLVQGVIWTGSGGVEDFHNYYRTLTWNRVTGYLTFRAENNHGTDLSSGSDYWWCIVGDALASGDIRAQIELAGNDDSAELAPVGFVLDPADWWAYKFENVVGLSPYSRIQVMSQGESTYHDLVPTAAFPVTGWIYGHRADPFVSGSVYVALSHSQLNALNVAVTGKDLATGDNAVLVDLGETFTNVGSDPLQ